jgi:thioredoxin 1
MTKLALPLIFACVVAGVVFLAVTKPLSRCHRSSCGSSAGEKSAAGLAIVNDAGFEKDVLNADKIVLVEFGAAWCVPCKVMAPVVREVGKQLDGKIKVVQLDVDDNPTSAERYGIRILPSFVVFKNAKAVERINGASTKQVLLDMINRHI